MGNLAARRIGGNLCLIIMEGTVRGIDVLGKPAPSA